ncbi:MAG TPA: protein kinase [Planctomycetaceae bacterium]|jgi:WD40 repeat protein/serine/threonine protein kinase|nr:protein kinase [Planctomycetaceae bacterium]
MLNDSRDHLSHLSPEQRAQVEDRIEAFEQAWQRGARPPIADYLPADRGIRFAALVELVHIDVERRAKAGESARVESYTEQFPELADLIESAETPPGAGGTSVNGVASTKSIQTVSEQPGAVIGPYKLMEQIGVGGFGLVFVAEQQRPVRRKVALKVIKPGMDTREVVARFEAERQALAMMDHPNIARVYDAGATDSGRPYFVMELVRGVPITDYCDQNHLTLRERLELFVSVCQAVQHAHQKGIIHRDIKPSNVLVTLQDGKPVAKVIDFGVAKALYQPLTDRTIYTRFAQMIGTPLYMSPEQAEAGGLDVDTRSDIYSLGVLLYELLTGMTPFDRRRLARAAYDEVIHIIRNEEPPKPSTRLSKSTQSLPAIAAQRKTDPARLSKMFRGDLDWITMKALEKDRTRRYETASGLAADIARYLNDEPVEASPPSTAYQLRKFARRYRTVLATAAAFVLLLVAAAVNMTWLTFRAQAEAENAQAEAAKARAARLVAEDERKVAEQEKRRADSERDRAAAASSRYEWGLYAWQIGAAQREWQANNVAGAWAQLNSCDPALRGWEYDYVYTSFTKNQRTLKGHSKEVCAVAFSADGNRIVSGSDDKTLKIWDVARVQETLTLKGHSSRVMSVAFSPDGKRIVSGGVDKTAKLWDATDGHELLTFKGHSDRVAGVAFSPDGNRIITASWDKTLRILDTDDGRELLTFRGHAGVVSCVAVSPDGKRIVSGSRDTTIKIWDTTTGKEVRTLRGHTEAVTSVAFGSGGKQIVSGSFDNTVKLWDASTGDEKLTLRGHPSLIWSVSFSPEGRHIASGSWDKTIKVWDAAVGREIFTLRGHVAPVQSVAFSPDGKWLASASDDHTIKLWQAIDGQEPLTRKGHTREVTCVAISSDGKRIVSGSWDNTLKVWDASTGQEILKLKGHTGGVLCVAFSPDGKWILSGSIDNMLKLWDAATGQELRTFKGHAAWVSGVAFSPSGNRIVSSSGDKTLKIWDPTDGREVQTLRGHAQAVTSLAFSTDGSMIVSGSADKTIKVWDLTTGREKRTLLGHTDAVSSVAISRDGKRILSGSQDKTLSLWDTASGREIRKLSGHTREVDSVALSPDGKRAVSGSGDYTIKVWNVDSAQETLTLRHSASVYSVLFSPDGKRIVSGSGDNTIKVWDASTSGQLPSDQLGVESPW